jgi:hypothetical protein
MRQRAINRNSSDFVEATTRRDQAAGNAQRFDRAVLLDRSHTGAIGLDAAADLDLARRTARFDAQGDGGKADHYALDQRRSGAAECLNATVNDEPADRLADLNAHCAAQALQSKAIAIENDLRGTLRNFGLKVAWSER